MRKIFTFMMAMVAALSFAATPALKDFPTFSFNGNDDVKYCVDVVAYYPYPELPDLSMIPPMKI
jgi:hypothetical protein